MTTSTRHVLSALAMASCLCVSGVALAQDIYDDEPSGLGIGISAGGGVTGFVDDNMRDVAGLGAAWDVRVTLGTRSMLALEAAYIGSHREVDLVIDDITLDSHGLEGNGRLNIGTFAIQPFALAGLGWTRYMVYDRGEQVMLNSDDDVLIVPVGAGVAFHAGAVALDLRGTYRFAFDDELFRDEAEFEDRPAFDNWSVTARAGLEF